MIDEKRKEFMGDGDDDLREQGFIEDYEKVDFSKFKIGKSKKQNEEQEEEVPTLFGRLTSAF